MKQNKVLAAVVAVAMVAAGLLAMGPMSTQAAAPTTNMSADVVIGQTDFSGHSENQGNASPAANTIALAHGIWSDGKKLIVPDLYNDRVLIYNSIPTENNASADVVVGQPDMSSNGANQNGAVGANTLSDPYFAFSDGIRLFIADSFNHRVLIYNTIPTSNNASADVVIGQTDFSGNDPNQGGAVAANTLFDPTAVYSDGTKLYIADSMNNRVLIFNTIPTANNASADIVIGQQDLTHNVFNQSASVGANTLFYPNGVFAYSGKLYISDDDNNRVLIYNTIPTSNNADADVVVGQPDMNSRSANQGGAVAANTMSDPIGVYSDGIRLIISQRANHRVLVYNTIPTTNNAAADVVIGQPDMSSHTANQGGAVAANTFNLQGNAYFAAGKLFVGDALNARVLIFSVDAANVWNNKQSKNFYGGIKGKLDKKAANFSGKTTNVKKGRVYIYRSGVLRGVAKIKNSGKWKFQIKEKQRGANILYQFRFYDRGNHLVSITDPFNVYLSGLKKSTLESSDNAQSVKTTPADETNVSTSGKNRNKNRGWPELKF